jgi:DNA-binding transcriptional ArsR family regulator
MSDTSSAESLLEAAAGAAGPHTVEAFAQLANETRLAILLALWEEYDPDAENDALPFSELYDRVDYGHSGNFSYHLEQLEGQFVRKRAGADGYELRKTGLKVVQSVIAGAGVEDATLERTTLDQACSRCGALTAVTYRDGVAYHVCTECEGNTTNGDHPDGYLNATRLDPAGLIDRGPEEVFAAAGVAAYREMRTMFEGLCSACSGTVEASLQQCEDHDSDGRCETCGRPFAAWTRFRCRVCKDAHYTTPTMLALFHPSVVAFYDEHGVSTQWHAEDFESVVRVQELVTDHHEMAVVSEEPLRVDVTVALDGDECRLTFDETASVIGVHR